MNDCSYVHIKVVSVDVKDKFAIFYNVNEAV